MKNPTYHIPYSKDNGARPYMAAKAAARRVPPVPRRNHNLSWCEFQAISWMLLMKINNSRLLCPKKKKDGIVWRPCLLGPPPHPAYINNDVHPFPQVDFLANREPLICLARPGVTWRGQDFWPTSEGMDAKCFSDQCQSVEQHLKSLKWKLHLGRHWID